jgi:hypothetical protein
MRAARASDDREPGTPIQRHQIMTEKVMKRILAASFLSFLAAACGGTVTAPSDTAIVTFAVGSEVFRVQLTGERQLEAARAAQAGGPANIPNGRIVAGSGVNSGWSWHLEDVEFAEVAIELCDGRPSDVEREGPQYGGGRYCPWGARVVSISATN